MTDLPSPSPAEFVIRPVAMLRTCYPQKFGIPRQSGLVPSAWGEMIFEPAFRRPEAVRGLEGFSHLWLITVFHEVHEDAIKPGQNVLVHDDLLATGGTAKAKIELVEKLGGNVVGCAFLIELTALEGRAKLEGYDTFSLISY